MLFSYGYGWQWNQRLQKMQANWWQFWSPCCRGDIAQCALPDGVHPWLHAKPLDTAIGQVPALYCPGGCHGQEFQMKHKNTNKMQLLSSFLTVDQHKKAKQFQDPKWTLYSAYRCNKLHWKLINKKILDEELAHISSYLTLSEDTNLLTYESQTKP
jgi:hypothetical protein